MRQIKLKYEGILYHWLNSYSYALSLNCIYITTYGYLENTSILNIFFLLHRQICFMIDLLKYWNSPSGKAFLTTLAIK